jgi:colanic acid biosynthesis glycosyl transferase WcaI
MLRTFNGGKLLYHIQDMQIEAARDLKMFYHKKVLASLFKIEHRILISADHVSSISVGMIDKIETKIKKDIVFFPNWVDTDFFKPLPNRHLLKTKWGYQPDDIIYLYSGAVGVKQGLEGILTAAATLQDDEHVKFVICASGPYKDELARLAQQKGLSNIAFLPLQDKEVFNEFLNMADIHLVMQKATAGDLVMPSKLATILAVGGISIITSSPGTSLYKMVNDYDLGYVVEPGNDELLVQKIRDVKDDKDLDIKRVKARNYALTYLNIDNVMNGFVANFLSEK